VIRRDALALDPASSGRGVRARAAARAETIVRAEPDFARLRLDLIAYLQRKGQTVDDAEDVVQEAFARFHRAGHDFAAPDARPLLFVIARNIQRDRWKALGREAVHRSGEDVLTLDSGPRAVASEARAADDRLMDRQALAAAAAAIRALPPRTRDAFLLNRFDNLTYRQIAQRLGVSVSMVEKHIAEALRQLKKTRER
jgi:RNA polymerase sigma-70 factor (ECF subfamily)